MVHLPDFGQAGKPAVRSAGENCTFFLDPNSLPGPNWGSGLASRTSGPVAMMFAPEFVDQTLASVSELVMLQSLFFHGVGVPPFTLIEHPRTYTHEDMIHALLALTFLALFCSVFAFLMWNRAIKMTNPQNIASTMHIKTPVAVVLGSLVASEALSLPIIWGTVFISFAVWLSQYKRGNSPVRSSKFVTKLQAAIQRTML